MFYLRLLPYGLIVFLALWGAWERNGKLTARMELATSANERATAMIEAQAKAHADHLAAVTEAVARGSEATRQAASVAQTIQRQTGQAIGALRGITNETDACLDSPVGDTVRGLLSGGSGALPGRGGARGVPAGPGGPDGAVSSGAG